MEVRVGTNLASLALEAVHGQVNNSIEKLFIKLKLELIWPIRFNFMEKKHFFFNLFISPYHLFIQFP